MPWWKVWKRKKDDKIEATPISAAKFAIAYILQERQSTFRNCNQSISYIRKDLIDVVEALSLGYILYVYLAILELRFGEEFAYLTRKNIITELNSNNTNLGDQLSILLDKIELGLKTSDCSAQVSGEPSQEYALAIYMLINLQGSPYYINHENRKNSQDLQSKFLIDPQFSQAWQLLGDHLILIKNESIETFLYMIFKIYFDPENIPRTIKSFEKKKNKIWDNDLTVANYISYLLINRKMPFFGWEPATLRITSELKQMAAVVAPIYMVNEFLILLNLRTGSIFSEMVKRDIIIILNDTNNIGEDINFLLTNIQNGLSQPNPTIGMKEELPQEFWLSIYLLMNLEISPYFLKPEERGQDKDIFQSKFGSEKDMYQKIQNFSNYLNKAKLAAIAIFEPVIMSMNFEDNYIQKLKLDYHLTWSKSPGCFERHLQRKHNNPLFPDHKRIIRQLDILMAAKLDNLDKANLENAVQNFIESIPNEFDPTKTETYYSLSKAIDNLIDQSYAINVDNSLIIEKLENIRSDLRNKISDFSSNGAMEGLISLENIMNSYYSEYRNAFILQSRRTDTPILKDEFYASLLTEDADTINAYLNMVHEESKLLAIKQEFQNILKKAANAGDNVSKFEKKLSLINFQK